MNRTLKFIARRVLLTIPVLFVMSVIVFLVMQVVPGDPAEAMLGVLATEESVQAVRAQLGLDRGLVEQYLDWAGGIVRGDFGADILSGHPIGGQLAVALPVTVSLAVGSMIVGLLLGVPMGVAAARGRQMVRRIVDAVVVAGIAVPNVWLGIMVILLFAVTWRLLPPSGYVSFGTDAGEFTRFLVLPIVTLAVGMVAHLARTVAGAMADALESASVVFLRASGIGERSIVWRHALRNAAPAIITVVGIQFGALLGGAIVIETIFDLPGLGNLLVTGIQRRNYPLIQAAALVIAALYILVNLITDVVIGWLDPRIADGRAQ